MKRILLIICVLGTTFTYGQKRLTAAVQKEYDEFGVLTDIDSTAYTYSSWTGSLTINKATPQFAFEGDFISYFLNEPMIHCDQDEYFNASTYPLPLSGDVTNNTIVDGRVSESQLNGTTNRELYEYNSLGQITRHTYEAQVSGIWTVEDSITSTYDASGNHLTSSRYDVSGANGLVATDSMWYAPGSNRVTKAVNYDSYGTGVMEIKGQTLVSYSGNEILNLDLFTTNSSGGVNWDYRLVYNYTGSQLNSFIGYEVVGNTPTTTVFADGLYTYTAQNQPASYTLILQGDTLGQTRWEYDTDGFISKQIDAVTDMNDALYDENITQFHYKNTAGISELAKVNVSIFPNPTSDILNITSESKIENVSVYTINGQLLIQQTSGLIDVNHLSKGTYIVKGKTTKGMFTENFIKQ